MPDPAVTSGSPTQNPARALARPAVALPVALPGVILFQLLFASMFAGTLLTLAAAAWHRQRPGSPAPQDPPQVAGAATELSLAS